jgi:hypothetical protein
VNVDPGDILREANGCTELDVTVSPNASRAGIEGIDPWRKRLVVKVRAVPKEGKANKELCDILTETFSAPVILVRGGTSRNKTVSVPRDRESIAAVLEGFV